MARPVFQATRRSYLLNVSDNYFILTIYFWIAGFVVTMGKSPLKTIVADTSYAYTGKQGDA